MARNRAQDYARGAAAGAPVAPPVADRLHLLCHLRAVLTHSPWVSGSSETTTSGQGATRREHEEKHTLVCKPLRYRVYYATAGFDTGAAAHPYEALSQLQCSWAVMPPPMTTTRGAGLAVVIWLPAAVHAIGGPSRWRCSVPGAAGGVGPGPAGGAAEDGPGRDREGGQRSPRGP